MEKNAIKGFFLNARKMCGGGSETANTLTNYLKTESSPCLCLTDSDKLHPNYKKSPTVQKCEEVERTSIQKIVKYHCFEEREIENIISHDLLKKIPNAQQFINELSRHIIEEDAQWKYVDIKDGVDVNWIEKKDSATRQYWKKAKAELESRKDRCFDCKKKTRQQTDVCPCGKISGLGNRVLVDVISFLNQSNTRINLKLLANDLRWEAIAKLTLDFTIAPQKERVRV